MLQCHKIFLVQTAYIINGQIKSLFMDKYYYAINRDICSFKSLRAVRDSAECKQAAVQDKAE
jgi:hypothetical protein